MAYDPSQRRVIMFGGFAPGLLQDLWEWDGDAGLWLRRSPFPLPPAWPSARQQHAMSTDPARKTVVLFGGTRNEGPNNTPTALRDVWEWHGIAGTWTDRTPAMVPTIWP